MDMVIIGASLAVVLMPLHHRISRHTLPEISAGIVTFLIFFMVCIMALFTFSILTSNVAILTKLFGTVGIWLDNPAANPLSFGIPVTRATLTGLLNQGMSLFVEYQDTLLSNLTLIAFKLFVFLTSLFYLLRWGEEIYKTFLCHVPAVLSGYVTRLSEVTVDTLYAIYIVQVAIAALTFVISIPVFYLLGYGDVLFFSFLAAFCELIPVLGSSVVFILVGTYCTCPGRYAWIDHYVFFRVPDRFLYPGILCPPGAGGQAGKDPSGNYVHRYIRGYAYPGACRFCAWSCYCCPPHNQLPDICTRKKRNVQNPGWCPSSNNQRSSFSDLKEKGLYVIFNDW